MKVCGNINKSQGRQPKRDLNPRFISPYPCNNPILSHTMIICPSVQHCDLSVLNADKQLRK